MEEMEQEVYEEDYRKPCKAIEDMKKEVREEVLREASKAMEEMEKQVREETIKAMEEREKQAREETIKAMEERGKQVLEKICGEASKVGEDKERETYEAGYLECYRTFCKILEDMKIKT